MAVAIVMRDRKASTSYLQRRLSIGYNRAADLIERMETEGLIGAGQQHRQARDPHHRPRWRRGPRGGRLTPFAACRIGNRPHLDVLFGEER